MNVKWRYVADIFMDVPVKFSYSDLFVSLQHILADLRKGTCVGIVCNAIVVVAVKVCGCCGCCGYAQIV